MENKRFYWIKLKTDFFNQDTIDYLLSQKNGCEYVVLYQMLCLQTANTNGELVNQIGEVIIPYNVEKIVRDTKHFDYDTVVVALELYKQIGLIYEEDNGNLRITDIEKMIGSESATREAIKKREQRLKKKIQEGTQKGTNCLTEYRDKSIEYRVKSIDNIVVEEEIKKEEENCSSNIIDYFNNNIHMIVQKEYEEITNWEKIFSDEMIIKAIDEAVLHNVKTMKYINSILRAWKEKGYKVPSDIESRNKKMNKQEIERWMNEDE